MHKKLIVNRTYPYCGNEINDVLEESGGHRDTEWLNVSKIEKQPKRWSVKATNRKDGW